MNYLRAIWGDGHYCFMAGLWQNRTRTCRISLTGRQPNYLSTPMAKRSAGKPVAESEKKHEGPNFHDETLVFTNRPDPNAPVHSFNFESPERLKAKLQIPSECSPITFLFPGDFLLGKDYWTSAVEIVCVDSDSEYSGAFLPFHLMMPSHRQIWRVRLFHFPNEILLSAIRDKRQFRLNLSSPSVPFVEIVWHPDHGTDESLHELQTIEPKDLKSEVALLLKLLKRWNLAFGKRGRKAGSKNKMQPRLSKESFTEVVEKAISQASESDSPLTRDAIAKRLGFSNGKALYRLQKTHHDNRSWRSTVRETVRK